MNPHSKLKAKCIRMHKLLSSILEISFTDEKWVFDELQSICVACWKKSEITSEGDSWECLNCGKEQTIFGLLKHDELILSEILKRLEKSSR